MGSNVVATDHAVGACGDTVDAPAGTYPCSIATPAARATPIRQHADTLGVALRVFAVLALAVLAAEDAGLEALAVLLQAPGLAAVAALVVLLDTTGRSHRRAWASSSKRQHAATTYPLAIFGRNAAGLRSKVASMASARMASFSWVMATMTAHETPLACIHRRGKHTLLLQQFTQLHVSLQYTPAAKHSQYSFVHREFLQLQLRFLCM